MKRDEMAMDQIVEQWPLERLKEFSGNPRKHTADMIERAAVAIREFGFRVPILAKSGGLIVDGHLRLKAARKLGLATVPVLLADDMSEVQIKAFRLSVNKIADLAEWNEKLLAFELDGLRDMEFALTSIGFAQQELNELIGTPNTGFDPDEVLVAPVVPVSRAGDLWLLGPKHRLLAGDSTKAEDVARLMGGAKAVLMNPDPPYGVALRLEDNHAASNAAKGINKTYRHFDPLEGDELTNEGLQEFLEQAIRAALPHLEKNAAFYLWHPMLTQGTFFAAAAADILIHRQIIWAKPHFIFGRGDYHWKHELCFYGWVRGSRPPFYGERNQDTVWALDEGGGAIRKDQGHPTQKPVELFLRPIRNHTRDGEIAYDPFVGSGSQIIAAEMTGCACYALEIAPQYVDVSVLRWQQFTGREATLDGDGRTFEEVKIDREKD